MGSKKLKCLKKLDTSKKMGLKEAKILQEEESYFKYYMLRKLDVLRWEVQILFFVVCYTTRVGGSI